MILIFDPQCHTLVTFFLNLPISTCRPFQTTDHLEKFGLFLGWFSLFSGAKLLPNKVQLICSHKMMTYYTVICKTESRFFLIYPEGFFSVENRQFLKEFCDEVLDYHGV